MKQTLFFCYFFFLALILNAQEPIFTLLERDTVYTDTCDSVDYCVTNVLEFYSSSEITVNGLGTEELEVCDIDTIRSYGLSSVGQSDSWAIEATIGTDILSFTVTSLADIADTFNIYYPECMWEYEESPARILCYSSSPFLGNLSISFDDFLVQLGVSILSIPTGFTLQLNYGENEIIMTHEDSYADTSIVTVVHEEQILEAVELSLSVGESETYFAESMCGSEMFTYVNLCGTGSTGAAELLTNGNSFEIKAVAVGVDTVCVR